MDGLATIKQRNAAVDTTDTTARIKANAREWLRRANEALDEGNFRQFRNLCNQAAREVEPITPVHERH